MLLRLLITLAGCKCYSLLEHSHKRNNHCKLLLLCAFRYFQWKVLIVEGEILSRSQTSNWIHSELSNFTCVCPLLPSGSELFSSTTYIKHHLVKLVIVQKGRRIFLQRVYIKRQFQIVNFFLKPIIYLE